MNYMGFLIFDKMDASFLPFKGSNRLLQNCTVRGSCHALVRKLGGVFSIWRCFSTSSWQDQKQRTLLSNCIIKAWSYLLDYTRIRFWTKIKNSSHSDYLELWAFIKVAEVILFEIPVLRSSAQWPIDSTWCIVRSIIIWNSIHSFYSQSN